MNKDPGQHIFFEASTVVRSEETFDRIASLVRRNPSFLIGVWVDTSADVSKSSTKIEVLPEDIPPDYVHLSQAQEFAELTDGFEPSQAVRIFNALGAAQERGALPEGIEIYDLTPGNEHLRDYINMNGIRQLVGQSTVHLLTIGKVPKIGVGGVKFLEAYSAAYEGQKKQREET